MRTLIDKCTYPPQNYQPMTLTVALRDISSKRFQYGSPRLAVRITSWPPFSNNLSNVCGAKGDGLRIPQANQREIESAGVLLLKDELGSSLFTHRQSIHNLAQSLPKIGIFLAMPLLLHPACSYRRPRSSTRRWRLFSNLTGRMMG